MLDAPHGESNFSGSACPTRTTNCFIVPNTIHCFEWEQRIANSVDVALASRRIFDIDPALEEYDYILIDTPPNLGCMVINALMVSHHVIIPIPTNDQFALDGFGTYLSLIKMIAQEKKIAEKREILLKERFRNWWAELSEEERRQVDEKLKEENPALNMSSGGSFLESARLSFFKKTHPLKI